MHHSFFKLLLSIQINVVYVSEILCKWFNFSLSYDNFCPATLKFLSSTLMYLFNPEDCLSCTVYIGETLVQV